MDYNPSSSSYHPHHAYNGHNGHGHDTQSYPTSAVPLSATATTPTFADHLYSTNHHYQDSSPTHHHVQQQQQQLYGTPSPTFHYQQPAQYPSSSPGGNPLHDPRTANVNVDPSSFIMMDQPLPSEYDINSQTHQERELLLKVLQERRRVKELELKIMEERRREREAPPPPPLANEDRYSGGSSWRTTGIQAGSFGVSAIAGKRVVPTSNDFSPGGGAYPRTPQDRYPIHHGGYLYETSPSQPHHLDGSSAQVPPELTVTTSTPDESERGYVSQRTQPDTYSGYYNANVDNTSPVLDAPSPVIPLTQQSYSNNTSQPQYGDRATLSAVADTARAAVTATLAGVGSGDEEDGESGGSWGADPYSRPRTSSTSPPSRQLGVQSNQDLTSFDSLRLHEQGPDGAINTNAGHALSAYGGSSDGSYRGNSSTPEHFYPMPPPSISMINQQQQQQQLPLPSSSTSYSQQQPKHPRLSFAGPNISGNAQPNPATTVPSMPSAPGPSTTKPSSPSTAKKPRKLLVERPIVCQHCTTPICKLLLRGFADEMNTAQFDLRYECQPCVVKSDAMNKNRLASSVVSVVQTKQQARKRTRQTEDTSMPTVCDVCVRTLGRGGLVPQVRDASLNFTTEVICHSCAAKYSRCSDCGGGSGRVGVGKWRAKEVFEHGRKTCRLPHVRLGGGEIEISVWEVPMEVERYKGGRELGSLMNAVKTLWSERVLARLAIPEVLEGNEEDWTKGTVEPTKRMYADVEDVIAKGWPSREKVLRTAPGPSRDHFRRYLGLSWTKSRARRDRAAGKLPDPARYADAKDVLSGNVRRTNVLVPPASQLVGMWIVDWDMRNRTLLLSTSVPFETSDAEDKNIIGVGEVLTRVVADYQKYMHEHPHSNLKPPQHLWVATRSISALGTARMNDTLTRRRGFVPVDEYIAVHPGTERSLFESVPEGHAWIDEPSWIRQPGGSPNGTDSADLEILVRWLGDNVTSERLDEIKDVEYGKKSKEMQIANRAKRSGTLSGAMG